MPRTVGERPVHPAAVAAFAIGVLVTGIATSEVIAYRLHFSADLGRPWLGPMYAPWSWLGWLWQAYNPFTGTDPITHRQHYVFAFYEALRVIPWVMGAGVLLSTIIYARITVAFSPKDEVKAIVDSAHFATIAEIREKTDFLTANCGLIFGKVETSPGVWEYLRWARNVGWNVVGTQGVGKTSDAILTQLLNPLMHPDAPSWSDVERRAHPYGYEPNFVVLDTKGSITEATSGYQKERLGKNVYIMSLLSSDVGRAAYNPLHHIRLGTIHEFDDCYRAGLDIVDESGEGTPKDYWSKVALDFAAAMIATIGYMSISENDPSCFSHPGLLGYISRFTTPEALIADMVSREHDPHGAFGWRDDEGQPTKQRQWIVNAARRIEARATEERSGIFGSFVSFIGMYASDVMRPHITRCTFDLKAMANDPDRASVLYIQMPEADLTQIRPFLRIMVKNFFRQLMTQTVTINGRELPGNNRQTRFILDEIRTLNKLEPLAVSSGTMRSHKVQLDAVWQARNQIEECYGKTETVTGNLGAHAYYRTQPGGDSEWLSKKCGQTSAVLQHRNLSGRRMAPVKGQIAEQNQVQTRYNLTEYEANELPADEKIVFADGLIIRVKQARYFENEIMRRRSLIPAVADSQVSVREPFYLDNLREVFGVEFVDKVTSMPPDRWAKARNEAAELENGCRVARREGTNKETAARLYFGQVWLPGGIKPVLDGVFPTVEEREHTITMALEAYENSEPDKPEQAVFVPHNEDPAISFLAALQGEEEAP